MDYAHLQGHTRHKQKVVMDSRIEPAAIICRLFIWKIADINNPISYRAELHIMHVNII